MDFPPTSSSKLLGSRDEQRDQSVTSAPALFVYVKIPVVADVADLGHKREDKIDQLLRETGIGSVIGWGDSLGDEQSNGSRVVAFHRIDIAVTDLPATRLALQATLPVLDVPLGTEIHYTVEGKGLMDVYAPSGWLLDQPIPVPRHRLGVTRKKG